MGSERLLGRLAGMSTVDSVGSGQGAVECSWEHGDGPSGSGAMKLILKFFQPYFTNTIIVL